MTTIEKGPEGPNRPGLQTCESHEEYLLVLWSFFANRLSRTWNLGTALKSYWPNGLKWSEMLNIGFPLHINKNPAATPLFPCFVNAEGLSAEVSIRRSKRRQSVGDWRNKWTQSCRSNIWSSTPKIFKSITSQFEYESHYNCIRSKIPSLVGIWKRVHTEAAEAFWSYHPFYIIWTLGPTTWSWFVFSPCLLFWLRIEFFSNA